MTNFHYSLCIYTLVVAVTAGSQNSPLKNETPNKSSEDQVLVCYYDAMSFWREDIGKFQASNIDANLCTHVVYSFLGLKEITNKIYSRDPGLDLGPGEIESDPDESDNNMGDLDMIRKTVKLRELNPDLKVLLSIGGPEQNSRSFSNMARHISNRTKFIDSTMEYIQKYEMDGVDIYWKYPADPTARPDDKDTLVVLMKELKAALGNLTTITGREYELTMAMGCTKDVIDVGYDVIELSIHVNHFNLMCFGFKGYSPQNTLIGHNSPLHWKTVGDSPADQQLTVEFGVNYFLQLGTPPAKLVLGVSTLANTYTLGIGEYHNFYDPTLSAGPPQLYTNLEGYSAYYEMCLNVKVNNAQWQFRYDYGYRIPYVFNPNDNVLLWFGYENEISAKEKVDYSISKGLRGLMIHFIDLDDCRNICGGWLSCPITTSIKERLSFWNRTKSY